MGCLKLTKNSGDFEKEDLVHSLNISEFIDPEKCSYFNIRKVLF